MSQGPHSHPAAHADRRSRRGRRRGHHRRRGPQGARRRPRRVRRADLRRRRGAPPVRERLPRRGGRAVPRRAGHAGGRRADPLDRPGRRRRLSRAGRRRPPRRVGPEADRYTGGRTDPGVTMTPTEGPSDGVPVPGRTDRGHGDQDPGDRCVVRYRGQLQPDGHHLRGQPRHRTGELEAAAGRQLVAVGRLRPGTSSPRARRPRPPWPGAPARFIGRRRPQQGRAARARGPGRRARWPTWPTPPSELAWAGMLVGLGVGLWCSFSPRRAPVLAPVYAVVEGVRPRRHLALLRRPGLARRAPGRRRHGGHRRRGSGPSTAPVWSGSAPGSSGPPWSPASGCWWSW